MHIPQLPTNHPWYFLSKYALPNVKWCEATLFSWVTEPANTWSNLAFIIVGIWMVTKSKGIKNPLVKFFGPMSIALGFFSGIYHASYTFVLQLGDFFGMYLVGLLPLYINLERLGVKFKNPIKHFFIVSIILTILTVPSYFIGFPIQAIVLFNIIAVIITEIKCGTATSKHFLFGVTSLIIAATFSALDVTRTMCDPDNHVIQGHALWHCFNSFMLVFMFKHYVIHEKITANNKIALKTAVN